MATPLVTPPASLRAASTTPVGRRPTRRQRLVPWAFLAPYLLLFAVFVLGPAVFGVWISFHNWNYLVPNQPWVGLQNYLDLFSPGSATNAEFWKSMAATGIFTVLSVPPLIVIPLLVALLLNERIRGRTAFRAIFFAPYVLGVAVVGVTWRYLLDTHLGPINAILGALGLPDDIAWTNAMPWAWIALVGVTVWWVLGFNTVIFLAGLQNINRELYETAELDGTGRIQRFVHVTVPGLKQVLVFVVIITILAAASMFGQAYLITAGGPGTDTRTVIMYIANEGLTNFRMGSAAAMSYLLFIILAVVSLVTFRIMRRVAE